MAENLDITNWLEAIGLGQYASCFAEHDVTPEMIPLLTDANLEAIGVAVPEDRERLLAAIAGAAPEAETAEAAPAPERVEQVPPHSVDTKVPVPAPSYLAHSRPIIPPPSSPSLVVTSAPAPVSVPITSQSSRPADKKKSIWAKLLTRKFLLVSIIVHLLFGLVATYFIVQRIPAKRKVTFQGGPPTNNASKRALEHKVSMEKKKKTGGAPPQAKRIVSAGLAKISLPDLPSVPTAANVVPGMMAGMGGVGLGTGMGVGNGMGNGMGGGGGGGLTMFGFRNAGGGGLPGEFYDLKQTRGRKPNGTDNKKYGEILSNFLSKGWQESQLSGYYKAPKPLYAAQFLIPHIDANLAPKAFGVEKEVQPERWVALYRGRVTAPDSGTFHFVGGGDDILFVKFDGKTVLNGSWINVRAGQLGGDAVDRQLGIKTEAHYDYGWEHPGGFPKGEGFRVEAGQTYPVEILIGEWPGGGSHFVLLIEKEGANYDKDGRGNPILPVFRFANVDGPKLEGRQNLPPHLENGPVWRVQAASTGSLLDALKR